MELEDAIEEAEDKGWSETLVYHEIFNILRKKKFSTDEEVSCMHRACIYGFTNIAVQQQRLNLMCEMRGDLFVWCPDEELIYTTNLKCLHSDTSHYRKIYQVRKLYSMNGNVRGMKILKVFYFILDFMKILPVAMYVCCSFFFFTSHALFAEAHVYQYSSI